MPRRAWSVRYVEKEAEVCKGIIGQGGKEEEEIRRRNVGKEVYWDDDNNWFRPIRTLLQP